MCTSGPVGNRLIHNLLDIWEDNHVFLNMLVFFKGLPPGVVNMVFGVGPKCGAALVQHPEVPIISFTGSTATGRYIIENSAPYFKKLSLEVC